jgi:type III secretory pathway component EscS
MGDKTQNTELTKEVIEIFTLLMEWVVVFDRSIGIEEKGFPVDTTRVDELSGKISEKRKELGNWLTNLSLTALAFSLTILIQINLREKVDSLDRFTVLLSLSSLTTSSILGLIDRFLSISTELVENLLKFPETFLNLPIRGNQQFGISLPEEGEKAREALITKIRNTRIKFSNLFPIFGPFIGKTRALYPLYQVILFLIGGSSLTIYMTIFIFDLNTKPLGYALKLLPVFITTAIAYPWMKFVFELIFQMMQRNI